MTKYLSNTKLGTQSIGLMSDLLYVQKSIRWETRLYLNIKMHLCFNHIRLLKQ